MKLSEFLQDVWYNTKVDILNKYTEMLMFEGKVRDLFSDKDNECLEYDVQVVYVEDDTLVIEVH